MRTAERRWVVRGCIIFVVPEGNTMHVCDATTFTAYLFPDYANQSVTWSTSDWNKVKVIGNTATAKKVSKSPVRLTATEKGTIYTAFIDIKVFERGHEDVPEEHVNPFAMSFVVGGYPAIITQKFII